jgi:hypothetical protein
LKHKDKKAIGFSTWRAGSIGFKVKESLKFKEVGGSKRV